MHRCIRAAVIVCATTFAGSAFAQSWQTRAEEFRGTLSNERKKLGLDKTKSFGTPEVKFVGTAQEDGLLGVVCPGETLVVKLSGVAAKSKVFPNVDDVTVSQESWAGTTWTGTLTAKKGAAPRTFSLVSIIYPSGGEGWSSTYLIGCKRTVSITAGSDVLTLTVDLRKLKQTVSGTWKRGATTSTANFEVALNESGFRVDRSVQPEDMVDASNKVQEVMSSPKWLALDKRTEVATAKLEGCSKNTATMMTCMQAVQPEMEKIGKEREALMIEIEVSNSPKIGCNSLSVNVVSPADSAGQGCSGKRGSEDVPLKATW